MKRSCDMSSCGRLCASRRHRHRIGTRHYALYCRLEVTTWRPPSACALTGGEAGCRARQWLAPTVRTIACASPSRRARVFARTAGKIYRRIAAGSLPDRHTRPSLRRHGLQGPQTLPMPVRNCLLPCTRRIIVPARRRRIERRFVQPTQRRQGAVNRCGRRTRRLRPLSRQTRTTLPATAGPWDVANPRPQSE
jgi:hypothetical protein